LEKWIGKSTILRALAIAIIGHYYKKIDENAKNGQMIQLGIR